MKAILHSTIEDQVEKIPGGWTKRFVFRVVRTGIYYLHGGFISINFVVFIGIVINLSG